MQAFVSKSIVSEELYSIVSKEPHYLDSPLYSYVSHCYFHGLELSLFPPYLKLQKEITFWYPPPEILICGTDSHDYASPYILIRHLLLRNTLLFLRIRIILISSVFKMTEGNNILIAPSWNTNLWIRLPWLCFNLDPFQIKKEYTLILTYFK